MRTSIFALVTAGLLTGCSVSQAQDAGEHHAGHLDLSDDIVLRAASECRFDALTDHAFEGLLLMEWEPRRVSPAPQVAIGDRMYTPQFSDTEMEGTGYDDIPPGREYASRVDFPVGSTWNGLPIRAMFVDFFMPPETDSLYRRGLTFTASPEQLQATLAQQGHAVPINPEYLALDEYSFFASQSCGGAIYIHATEGGSQLVCDRGC